LRAELRGRLAAAGIEGALREADWIIEAATGMSRARLMAADPDPLDPKVVERARAAVARREAREPLQYILGETDFYGRTFNVAPGVLIPRPETELLVERALEGLRAGPVKILDIGTGSGCIACTVSLERPEAFVKAIDLSAAALVQARANAERLGAKVEFVELDLFHGAMTTLAGKPLDMMLSNPPYVPDRDRGSIQPELSHEPPEALFTGGPKMRFITRLAEVGQALLSRRGRLLIEIHTPDAGLARETLENAGYEGVKIYEDLAGMPRVLEGIRDGR